MYLFKTIGCRDHMRIHSDRSKDDYQHLCPHCGQKFSTASHMNGHIRTKHTGETPYKCEDCQLGMTNNSFKCRFSSPLSRCKFRIKAFHRSDLLAQHRLKHVPRFICAVCGKSLSSKERLKAHVRYRHPSHASPATNDCLNHCLY